MTTYKPGDRVLVEAEIVGSDVYFKSSPLAVDDNIYEYRLIVGLNPIRLKPHEIYSIAPPFKPGEVIEVREGEHCEWVQRKFIGVRSTGGFICETLSKSHYSSWPFARPLQQSLQQPSEPETLVINGYKYTRGEKV